LTKLCYCSNNLSKVKAKGGQNNGNSLLHEVQEEGEHGKSAPSYAQEQETGDPGCLP